MGRALTIEELQAIAATHGGRCLSTHYVNANTRLKWECAEGHRWLAIPNSVKRGTWCLICAVQGTRLSLADVQRVAANYGGRCLSPEYVNGTTPLLFECAPVIAGRRRRPRSAPGTGVLNAGTCGNAIRWRECRRLRRVVADYACRMSMSTSASRYAGAARTVTNGNRLRRS